MEQLHQLVGTHGDDISWWQMSLRGVLIFTLGLLIVRVAASRAFGRWSALDIILAVVVGSNLSRALTGGAPFLATLAATLVLVVLHGLLARAVIRWPTLSDFFKGKSVLLVEDGAPREEALRRHGIGRGDLRMALRARGVDELSEAKAVYLERNGDISVVRADSP